MIATDLRTLYIRPTSSLPKLTTSDSSELRRSLEEGPDSARLSALKSLIVAAVNGERELVEGLLMTLIRFVLPLKDKTIKKLLLLLFENMNKTDSEGNLKQEFILVCNSWRNDLQHPNEYIRGATLRFLCHLSEAELLEPLMPSVRSCLDHEHVYVRKNAICAIASIYKNVDYLIPDAPELIEGFLSHEPEITCQKLAFLFLSRTEPKRATNFFNLIADRISEMDLSLQLAVIEFVRCSFADSNEEETTRYSKVLVNLLKKSGESAAKYESATVLIQVSSGDSELVKISVDALIGLATREADNSIKLMILSKLKNEILPLHLDILQGAVLDLLRVLGSPDLTVRTVCLELISASTTSRVVLEIVQFLKKELAKPDLEYRKSVLDALYKNSMNFSEVGTEVMNAYLDLLKNGFVTENLVSYMKEALFKYPKLRQTYLSSVIAALPSVSDSKSLRSLLWLIGEFCVESGSILAAIQSINSGLGELPMLACEEKYEAARLKDEANDVSAAESTTTTTNKQQRVTTKVLADGTYASEVLDEDPLTTGGSNSNARQVPNIKRLFLDGKFECTGVLADCLCKLMVRIKKCTSVEAAQYTALRTRVLLMLTSILRLGGSKFPTQPIDRDSAERVALCIQVLLGTEAELEKAFTDDSDSAFKSLHTQNKRETTTTTTHSNDNEIAIDTPIRFALLSPINTPKRAILLSPDAELDLVLSEDSTPTQPNTSVANLNRVVQLTGFSDAIYAETYVQMSGKEVLLDLLLVNQTEETLQNVSIDLLCAGDLKLIEKPPQLTLPAFAFSACKAIFKVTATNHGQIFGCISFLSGTQAAESETVILSEIKIDVLEYIKPAFIDETLFRDTWVLLEWENKISIKVAKAGELDAFLKYILAQGHLTCITPNVFIQKQQQQQQGKAEDASKENIPAFLACNLYAKSIFDEEILANLCLEINQHSKQITGHLRLRSKTQGLAVAFGDKLNTLIQKLK